MRRTTATRSQTEFLLIDDGAAGVRAVHVRPGDGIKARLHARRIDRELADGASPDRDAETAVRARHLTGMAERHRLVEALEHALVVSIVPRSSLVSASVLDRFAVASAREEIVDLCTTLSRPGPVSVRGVACVRALLTDGSGPFFDVRSGRSLGVAVRHATGLLELDALVG
jgi:hypothetical protein